MWPFAFFCRWWMPWFLRNWFVWNILPVDIFSVWRGLFGKQGKKLWWFWFLKLLSNSNLRALCLHGGDIPSWKQACRSYHQPQILDDFRYASWREAISMNDSPSHHPETFFWNGFPSKFVVSQNFEPGLQPKSIQIISDMLQSCQVSFGFGLFLAD